MICDKTQNVKRKALSYTNSFTKNVNKDYVCSCTSLQVTVILTKNNDFLHQFKKEITSQ